MCPSCDSRMVRPVSGQKSPRGQAGTVPVTRRCFTCGWEWTTDADQVPSSRASL